MISKSIVYNNQQNNINGAIYDVNLGRNIICGVNDRGDGEYDPSGLVELMDTLALSRCLRTLNLEKNYIGVPSCAALGKLLETRNPLSHLKYVQTFLFVAVTICVSLATLIYYLCCSLKGCSITTEEMTKLVSKMKKNTHLQILK
jgi:hypothetical protein